jgi:hypothetical protein
MALPRDRGQDGIVEKLVSSPRIRLHVAQGRELLVEPGFKVDTQAGVTTLPESGSDQQPRRNGTSDPPVSVSERMTRSRVFGRDLQALTLGEFVREERIFRQLASASCKELRYLVKSYDRSQLRIRSGLKSRIRRTVGADATPPRRTHGSRLRDP